MDEAQSTTDTEGTKTYLRMNQKKIVTSYILCSTTQGTRDKMTLTISMAFVLFFFSLYNVQMHCFMF